MIRNAFDLHRGSGADEVVEVCIGILRRKRKRSEKKRQDWNESQLEAELAELEQYVVGRLSTHNVFKLWQIRYVKFETLLELGIPWDLSMILRAISKAFNKVEKSQVANVDKTKRGEEEVFTIDLLEELEKMKTRRKQHSVSKRNQFILLLLSCTLILGGLAVIAMSIVATNGEKPVATWIWTSWGSLLVIINAYCWLGAERVVHDVLAETGLRVNWSGKGSGSSFSMKRFSAGAHDGLETPGQRMLQSAFYGNLLCLIWLCFLSAFSLSDGRTSDDDVQWKIVMISLSTIPVQFASFFITTVIVSLYEMLQSLAEVFAVLVGFVCGVQAIGSIWLMNRALSTLKLVKTIPIWIPALVFAWDMAMILVAGITFAAIWKESLKLLRISRYLIFLMALPLVAFQLASILAFDLAEVVEDNCSSIMNSVSEAFFEFAFDCTKYDGVGRIQKTVSEVEKIKGPGETVFCGIGAENKSRGAFVWERNPVVIFDGNMRNYFGCLNLACCSDFVRLAQRLDSLFIAIVLVLLLFSFFLYLLVGYLLQHVTKYSHGALLEAMEEKLINQKGRKHDKQKVFRHEHAPCLTLVFASMLALVVVAALVTSYGGVSAKTVNYRDLTQLSVELPESCDPRTGLCPSPGVCTAVIGDGRCCINGFHDGNETGVDCGFLCEAPCEEMQPCVISSDCLSGNCCKSICQVEPCAVSGSGAENFPPASCSNGVRDGRETCLDGGGPDCVRIECDFELADHLINDCQSSTVLNEFCDISGRLCGLDGACLRNADCDAGLYCDGLFRTCQKLSRNLSESSQILLAITSAPNISSYVAKVFGRNDRSGIGENCERDEDCYSFNCVEPSCHGHRDAGESHRPCSFPFIFHGTLFTSCADGDDDSFPRPFGWNEQVTTSPSHFQSRYWCSFSRSYSVTDKPDDWGFCDCGLSNVNGTKSCASFRLEPGASPTICEARCSSGCALLGYSLCGDSGSCLQDNDCNSNLCRNNSCVSCGNELRDGLETGIDCGGPDCSAKCPDGSACNVSQDCKGGGCVDGSCISCEDGVLNGGETCVDGGGAFCAKKGHLCGPGKSCQTSADCEPQLGNPAFCVETTCTGSNDGVQNLRESDVDCGGSDSLVPRCQIGDKCLFDDDCLIRNCDLASLRCRKLEDVPIPSMCQNGEQDHDEDCVDGGGSVCSKWNRLCSIGSRVGVGNGRSCETGLEYRGSCIARQDFPRIVLIDDSYPLEKDWSECFDGALSPWESDIDCGGDICRRRCTIASSCNLHSDCQTGLCIDSFCKAISEGAFARCVLKNGIKDAWESDVDCGGECSFSGVTCEDGKRCDLDRDCLSHHCEGHVCVSCFNGIQDGLETSIDCGGLHCRQCGKGDRCEVDIDCKGFPLLARCGYNKICQNKPMCVSGEIGVGLNETCDGSHIVSFESSEQNKLFLMQGRCTKIAFPLQIQSFATSLCPAPSTCRKMDVQLTTPDNVMIKVGEISAQASISVKILNQGFQYTLGGPVDTLAESLSQDLEACFVGFTRTVDQRIIIDAKIVQIDTPCQAFHESETRVVLLAGFGHPTYIVEADVWTPRRKGGWRPANNISAELLVSNYCFEEEQEFCNDLSESFQAEVRFGKLRIQTNISSILAKKSELVVSFPSFDTEISQSMRFQSTTTIDFGDIFLGSELGDGVPSSSPPTRNPTARPSFGPITTSPSMSPTSAPSQAPSQKPMLSTSPSESPSKSPSQKLTQAPSSSPSLNPTNGRSSYPTASPTRGPSEVPTRDPSERPINLPTEKPSSAPSVDPTLSPTATPSENPSQVPSRSPSQAPSNAPSVQPTMSPSRFSTGSPTNVPTRAPTESSATFLVASTQVTFCGGRASQVRIPDVVDGVILNVTGSDGRFINSCKIGVSCSVRSPSGDFRVTMHGDLFEETNFQVSCEEATGCSCSPSSICTQSQVRSSLFTIWSRERIPESSVRACLWWEQEEADLDLSVVFPIADEGSAENTCEINSRRLSCGSAELVQQAEAKSDGAEGVLISKVHRSIYSFSLENYLENIATETTGAFLTLDGFGISSSSAAKFSLGSRENLELYSAWPGPWTGGMFREESKYARLVCLDATDEDVMRVAHAPFYSLLPTPPLLTCPPYQRFEPNAVEQQICESRFRITTFSEQAHDAKRTPQPTSFPTSFSSGGLVGGTGKEKEVLVLFPKNRSATESRGKDLKVVRPQVEAFMPSSQAAFEMVLQSSDGSCLPATDHSSSEALCRQELAHLCTKEEIALARGSAIPSSCDAGNSEHYAWTATNCLIDDNVQGVAATTIWPMCQMDSCSNEIYPGEGCWHDGRRPKSCKKSWEKAGVFAEETTFVNTLSLCDLCEADEDCRLYVFVGFPGISDPVYEFHGEIPAAKVPGFCGIENTSCGTPQDFLTYEDGRCFDVDYYPGDKSSCSCDGGFRTDSSCFARNSTLRTFCCRSVDAVEVAFEESGESSQVPMSFDLPGPEIFQNKELFSQMKVYFPLKEISVLWVGFFETSTSFARHVRLGEAFDVDTSCEASSSSTLSRIRNNPESRDIDGSLSVKVKLPRKPGYYYVCILRAGDLQQDGCSARPFCTVEDPLGTLKATADFCQLVQLNCKIPGRSGEDCEVCDAVDSDMDGILDCDDFCPFDERIQSSSQLDGIRWCGDRDNEPFLGERNTTISGRSCQKWSQQFPHEHSFLRFRVNDGFCDRSSGDPCGFPFRDDSVSAPGSLVESGCVDNGRFCAGMSSEELSSSMLYCSVCNKTLHFAARGIGNHNFCRNPDADTYGSWCFTQDPLVRWEYCDESSRRLLESESSESSSAALMFATSREAGVWSVDLENGTVEQKVDASELTVMSIAVFREPLTIPEYLHVGCINLDPLQKVEEESEVWLDVGFQTPANCAQICKARMSKYFSLHDGGKTCSCYLRAVHFKYVTDGISTDGSCVTDGSGNAEQGLKCTFPFLDVSTGRLHLDGECINGMCAHVESTRTLFGGCVCHCNQKCNDDSLAPCGGPNGGARSLYSFNVPVTKAIVSDAASGALVALDEDWNRIGSFHNDVLSSPGTVLALPGGNILVTDRTNGSILIFAPTRVLLHVMLRPAEIQFTSLQTPMVVTSDGAFVDIIYGFNDFWSCKLPELDCRFQKLWYPAIEEMVAGSAPRALTRSKSRGSNLLFVVDQLGAVLGFRGDKNQFFEVVRSSGDKLQEVDDLIITAREDIVVKYSKEGNFLENLQSARIQKVKGFYGNITHIVW